MFIVRGGREKPGVPTCQGRVRTDVGPGTEAEAKAQLIDQLWPRRGSRGARVLWRIRDTPPPGQLGNKMLKEFYIALSI